MATESVVTTIDSCDGALPVGFARLPFDATVHTETCTPNEAPPTHKGVHAGKINGREVIQPSG